MKGDFSRNTFDPHKHFTRVLMQQGRVQLDADWNEQVSILLHYLQTLAADLIGPHGGPAHDLGFAITPDGTGDFAIGKGHYYVDGILCENQDEHAAYKTQPDDPFPEDLTADGYLVYLDVWERHIAYVEDEDEHGDNPSIREVALATADTASRARVVWQVKALAIKQNEEWTGRSEDVLTEMRKASGSVRKIDERLSESPKSMPIRIRRPINVEINVLGEIAEQLKAHHDEPALKALREPLIAQVEAVENLETLPEKGTLPSGKIETFLANYDRVRVGISAILVTLAEELAKNRRRLSIAKLRARALQDPGEPDDPCTIPPDSRYRGRENQLYRVEIHKGEQVGEATFKWSRENGSVIFPIEKMVAEFGTAAPGADTITDTAQVTLRQLWRDDRFKLQVGNWIEIVDDDYTRQGRAEALWQVDAPVDRDKRSVSLKRTRLASEEPSVVGQAPSKHPYLRRWDHTGGDPTKGELELDDEGAVLIKDREADTDNNWLTLEDGIQVQFQKLDPASKYRTGDYWLIPARTATGDVEWPGPAGNPEAIEPHGVVHHYAPLAIISLDDGQVQVEADCRRAFSFYQ